MLLRLLLLLVVLIGAGPLQAQKAKRHAHTQQSEPMSARQSQLRELQRTIQQRERKIRDLADKERNTARAVKELEQLLERQRRYVRLLDDELRALASRQRALEGQRNGYRTALSNDVERIRRFVLLLAQADLHQAQGDDDSALDTAIVGAALRRLESRLQTTHRQHDSTRAVLDQLQQYRAARELLMAQQQREQQRLERMLWLRTQLLSKLRRDRQSVEQELKKLRTSMAAIERTIERLSRSGRKASSAPLSKGAPLPALQPPVRGAIICGYGEYRHPLTGARAFNAGVDLAVPVGTAVHAAADGTVASVQWLPAMNTVVIIDHGNGLRTVYGNLDRASVQKGKKVRTGQTIGTSGESLSGACVHFELWRGSERLDPTFVVR